MKSRLALDDLIHAQLRSKFPITIVAVDPVEGGKWAVLALFGDGQYGAFLIPDDLTTQKDILLGSVATAVVWVTKGCPTG